MTFVHTGFLSEYHAEMTYLTVGLPPDKSFEDLKADWLKVRKNDEIGPDSLDDSLKELVLMGYVINDLDIFEFFEKDLPES